MAITVKQLQEWVEQYYPEDYEFTKILKYWVNKYTQENSDE